MSYESMMRTITQRFVLAARPITFTRRDGDLKTTLTLDEVRSLALIGLVVSRHYQRRAQKTGNPTVLNQMRKQGLPLDFCMAVLGQHPKVNAPKEPTLWRS